MAVDTLPKSTIIEDGGNVISIDDAAGSLTVDNTALSVTGGGVEATALRVTLASDSTGVVSVDDNGASLTVDGTVAATQSGVWNITDVSGTVSLPTGAATSAKQDTQTTALQLIDDTVHSGDAAVSKYNLIGAVLDDVATGAVTENQANSLRMSSRRALLVEGVASGTNINVIGASNSGVDIGDVTINNASGGSAVNIQDGGNSITIDGTVAVSSLPASTNTLEIVGDVAHDAAAAGNPVLIAGSDETMADSAPANRVSADADASRLSTTDGALFVVPTGPQIWSYHLDTSSAQTDASVHAAPGVGLSLYVQTISVSTGAATALNVFFEEGASKVLGPYYLEAIAGRGFVINFLCPKKITANTALTVTTSAAIAHCVDVTGFIAHG